jgi:hypothetical protein
MKYKSEWKPNELNKEFWSEVLVGRKIESVEYVSMPYDEGNERIGFFNLDSGERVGINSQGILYIMQNLDSEK